MSSIFTRIIQGEIPCHKLFEDEECISFLDVRPINPGHALVIPKQETDYIFDLPDDSLQHLVVVAKRVGLAIDRSVSCERVGIIVAGLEVPHAHIHLVPIQDVGDINFANAKPAEEAELADVADRILAQLA
jgi:histidine triad (HIT) family protein